VPPVYHPDVCGLVKDTPLINEGGRIGMKKLRDSASQGEKKSLEDEEGRKKFGGSGSPASSKSMEFDQFLLSKAEN